MGELTAAQIEQLRRNRIAEENSRALQALTGFVQMESAYRG